MSANQSTRDRVKNRILLTVSASSRWLSHPARRILEGKAGTMLFDRAFQPESTFNASRCCLPRGFRCKVPVMPHSLAAWLRAPVLPTDGEWRRKEGVSIPPACVGTRRLTMYPSPTRPVPLCSTHCTASVHCPLHLVVPPCQLRR